MQVSEQIRTEFIDPLLITLKFILFFKIISNESLNISLQKSQCRYYFDCYITFSFIIVSPLSCIVRIIDLFTPHFLRMTKIISPYRLNSKIRFSTIFITFVGPDGCDSLDRSPNQDKNDSIFIYFRPVKNYKSNKKINKKYRRTA